MNADLGRSARIAVCAALGLTLGLTATAFAQSTPATMPDRCADAAVGMPMMEGRPAGMMGTPGAGMPMMGSPAAGMGMGMDADHRAMGLDLMYVDMMIPHHASIIAMAEAALPRLQDERLRTMAEAIVSAQTAEIDELRDYREDLAGDRMPMPMDGPMMAAMAEMMPGMMSAMNEMMPGMGSMEEMAFQMDAAAQVAAICGAEDADRAFIDLTIPHHAMVIASSRPVVEGAESPALRDFAQKVIDAQQREIEELRTIRQELYGSATPEAVGAGS